MLESIKLKFGVDPGPEYNIAAEMAQGNAYYRLDEYNPAMLAQLTEAIESGANADTLARVFLQEAGHHRAEMARDLRNAGRFIERMLVDEAEAAYTMPRPGEAGETE